ncbi:hypothetical protein HYU12_03120 [Candidatus Woesearchaeota archaeon]|nr:hypothetical protein [Candidatus Woesearchaeota archaeon]
MKVVSEQPLFEISLRKYEKPHSLKERELVKKLCLSLGMLQPGDSRDVVVDVFHVLLKSVRRKKLLNVAEIEKKVIQNRKLHRIAMLGVASSNIRRQLKRLRNILVIEKVKSRYRVCEFMPLKELFEAKIEKLVLQDISDRIKEYLSEADSAFGAGKR